MRVLIAGAGVGGLTLALMLHKRGIESVIFEQASEIREVGVGINILPHAIKELAALDLMPKLDAAGIRTKELHYVSRLGQKVWSELRGTDAGFDFPQFSIHRGRLQKVIHDEVMARLGPGAIRFGLKLQGFVQDEGGVVAHFTDAKFGLMSETVRGDVLVGADGIHSVVRRHFHPKQGRPSWQGLMLWRGAVEWPKFLTGSSMYVAGGMSAKIALYPIAPGSTPDTRLTNWAIVSRIADGEITPPPIDSWSRVGRMDEVIPYARRFKVPGVDVELWCGRRRSAGNIPCATATRCLIGVMAALHCSATPLIRCTPLARTAPRRRSSMRVVSPIGCGNPTTRCKLWMRMNASACRRPPRSCASTAKAGRSASSTKSRNSLQRALNLWTAFSATPNARRSSRATPARRASPRTQVNK